MSSKQKSIIDCRKPGCFFKDDCRKAVNIHRGRILVSISWPPKAWELTTEKPFWVHVFPKHSIYKTAFRMSVDDSEFDEEEKTTYKKNFIRFYERIPLQVRETMMSYKGDRWDICSLMARTDIGKCADLLHSNPAMLFMLGNLRAFRKYSRPYRKALELLSAKQTDALEWLGFPKLPGLRKALGKIPTKECSLASLLTLRKLLNESPGILALTWHLETIDSTVICLLNKPKTHRLLSHNLLNEITRLRTIRERCNAVSAIVETSSLLPKTSYRPAGFQALSQINHCHNRIAKELMFQDPADTHFPFPQAPFPAFMGNGLTIKPVLSVSELRREGEEMKNCLKSIQYVRRILSSNHFIYKVTYPERLTIELVKVQTGKWLLYQIKAIRNRKPKRSSTVELVKKWLRDEQRGNRKSLG